MSACEGGACSISQLGSPPCQKDCVGPGLLFPTQKVGNDGGEGGGVGYSLLNTQVVSPPPKAEWHGAADCRDGGGIFCVCCFALAWPSPACEGCMMPKGVAAGPRSILGS